MDKPFKVSIVCNTVEDLVEALSALIDNSSVINENIKIEQVIEPVNKQEEEKEEK